MHGLNSKQSNKPKVSRIQLHNVDTLSWFKESVILSLCGNYASRKYHSSIQLPSQPRTNQSLQIITRHQIRPQSQIPDLDPHTLTRSRFLICNQQRLTSCLTCKHPYCYDCCIEHIRQLLQQHFTASEKTKEEKISSQTSQLPQYSATSRQ